MRAGLLAAFAIATALLVLVGYSTVYAPRKSYVLGQVSVARQPAILLVNKTVCIEPTGTVNTMEVPGVFRIIIPNNVRNVKVTLHIVNLEDLSRVLESLVVILETSSNIYLTSLSLTSPVASFVVTEDITKPLNNSYRYVDVKVVVSYKFKQGVEGSGCWPVIILPLGVESGEVVVRPGNVTVTRYTLTETTTTTVTVTKTTTATTTTGTATTTTTTVTTTTTTPPANETHLTNRTLELVLCKPLKFVEINSSHFNYTLVYATVKYKVYRVWGTLKLYLALSKACSCDSLAEKGEIHLKATFMVKHGLVKRVNLTAEWDDRSKTAQYPDGVACIEIDDAVSACKLYSGICGSDTRAAVLVTLYYDALIAVHKCSKPENLEVLFIYTVEPLYCTPWGS